MFTIRSLTSRPSATVHNGLSDLLRDAVEGESPVGFLAPLNRATADSYWQEILHEIESPLRVILIATTATKPSPGRCTSRSVQKKTDAIALKSRSCWCTAAIVSKV